MNENEEMEKQTNLCQHQKYYRLSPGWKQEDILEGWCIQRQYQREQCTICKTIRFTRALDNRRRYHFDPMSENQPIFLKHLPIKQWRTIEALIAAMKRNRFEMQALLIDWAEAGWVEIEETWTDSKWQLERVRLSPLLVHQKQIQQIQAQDVYLQQSIKALSSILYQWKSAYQEAMKKQYEDDLIALLSRIYNLFEEQDAALAKGSVSLLTGTTMKPGGAPHVRWVALLRGIIDLLANPRIEHERIFSARWLYDSKAFRQERDALNAFLSIEGGLERIGLVKHTPTVLSWGAWEARWNGFLFDGQAGFSFISIASDVIIRLIEMQVKATKLLIIENQTPFEILVQPERRDPYTLYLFGAGLPGHAQRSLTALWLRAKPSMPWSVWTDYDPGGVAIQQFWHNWAIQEHLSEPHPYRWTYEDLASCQAQGIPLTVEQREQLAKMQNPLAQLLNVEGYAIEQEAILSIHGHW